jgi:hypothetical protein
MLVLLSNRRHITSSSSQLANQVGGCVGVADRSRQLIHDVALVATCIRTGTGAEAACA